MDGETYSLLQTSLDQRIGREALAEASDVIPTLARYDCVGLANGLFGIVASHLPEREALAFQLQLRQRGHETVMVADRELPKLPESFPIRRIKVAGDRLLLSDSIGRELQRPLRDLVFMAAGFMNRQRIRRELKGFSGVGNYHEDVTADYDYKLTKHDEFRLDLFFHTGLRRMQVMLDGDFPLFFNDQPIRLKHRDKLVTMLGEIAKLLPAPRLNQVLRSPKTARTYPRHTDYEEEIRWHFHQLRNSS